MKHVSRLRRLAPLIALALAAGAPLLAQEDGPVPLGPAVQVDQSCTFAPAAIETEGQVVALWNRQRGGGLTARSGPSLAELGPVVTLGGGSLGEIPVAAQPGGFVVAGFRFVNPQIPPQLVYQRFTTDLAALAPAVVVDDAPGPSVISLLASEDGEVTIAYFDLTGHVRVRRYSAADVPLTAAIEVDPAVTNPLSSVLTRLAAGPDGFLVAWEGSPTKTPGLWVRAFGWDGVPAAPSARLTSIPTADFDVAAIDGGYLAALPAGEIQGYWLGANGFPLGPPVSLAHGGTPFHLLLVASEGALWAAFLGAEGGILGARIEPGAMQPVNSSLLVPRPEGKEYVIPTGIAPATGGFLLGWRLGETSIITTPDPCSSGLAVFAQAFGPPPAVVDVPILPPPGLLGLALLLAAAGLLALRR